MCCPLGGLPFRVMHMRVGRYCPAPRVSHQEVSPVLSIRMSNATPWLAAACPATDAGYGSHAKLRVDGAFAPNPLVRRVRIEQTSHTTKGGVGRPRPAWSRPVTT